jgi:hypothetical protein
LEELRKTSTPEEFLWVKMTNEVHPWNLFTSDHAHDGGVPNKAFIKWMVDAMNEKAELEKVNGVIKRS